MPSFAHTMRTFVLLGSGLAIAPALVASPVDPNLFASPVIPLPYRNSHTPLIADLNGDGTPDLFVRNHDSIAVALQQPSHAFTVTISDTVATSFAGQAIALDVDADGDLDVIDSTQLTGGGDQIWVMKNDGAGGLAADIAVLTLAPNNAVSVAVDDLDGDGDPDLLVLQTELTVYLNQGLHSGTFASAGTFPFPGENPLRLADLDGDGDLDAFAGVSPDDLMIAERTGVDAFGPPQTLDLFPGSEVSMRFELADLNGDGAVDIMASRNTSFGNGLVFVFINDGSGNFGPPISPDLTANNSQVSGVLFADVDQDQDLDCIATVSPAAGIHVSLNDGAGNFAPPRAIVCSNNLLGVSAGDINGDGWVDIAGRVNWLSMSSPVVLILGAGPGVFAEPVGPDLGGNGAAGVADLDCDGDPDIVAVDYIHPQAGIRYLINDGTGTLLLGQRTQINSDPRYVTAGDLDGDCANDAVWGNEDLALADVDGDGDLDVFEPRETINGSFVLVRVNLGDGSFDWQFPLIPTIARPNRVDAADMNSDGLTDIIVAGRAASPGGPAELGVMLNDGLGALDPPVVSPTPHTATDIVVADVNDDGAPDVVMTTDRAQGSGDYPEESILVFLNDGLGQLTLVGDYPAGVDLTLLALGDLDNDGLPEAVATQEFRGAISILKGLPGGAFGPPVFFGGAPTPFALDITDTDGDGDQDIMIGIAGRGPVIWRNRLITTIPAPACAGDINNDGATNASDFVILAGNFGASVTPNTSGDLNGDGLVNASDFVILAGDFGCTP